MLKKYLGMNDDERQNLTTLSMLGGAIALTGAVGVLVYILRFKWPDRLLDANAPALISGLFNVIYGCLALMGVMVVAQAVIAIGGKMRAAFAGAEIEASTNDHETV